MSDIGVMNYPLDWPPGYDRTLDYERQRARFSKQTRQSEGWARQEKVTVHEACTRLIEQANKFTKPGQPWRINLDLVVISTNIPTRLDGRPRSGRRKPEDPGVAFYFELDGKDIVLACDKWDRVADNIVAIAKTMEAMRGLERWGVSDMLARAFTGFEALPAPDAVDSWRVVLGVKPDDDWDTIRHTYLSLRSTQHPDRGGDPHQFNRIQEAYAQAKEEFAQ